jgi:predicted nucleic acid-binding protein
VKGQGGPWYLHFACNLSSYDAGYVALAELIGATVVTLDERIGRAPGLRCTVVTPPRSVASEAP